MSTDKRLATRLADQISKSSLEQISEHCLTILLYDSTLATEKEATIFAELDRAIINMLALQTDGQGVDSCSTISATSK